MLFRNIRKLIRYIVSGYIFKVYYNKQKLDIENEYDLIGTSDSIPDAKVVIYTVVTGAYDKINDPDYLDDRFEYAIVTDQTVESAVWKRHPIPDKIKNYSSLEQARYIKTHPHEIFSDYDYTIFIDGNVIIKQDIWPLINGMIASGKKIAIHKHQNRDCLYDEARAVYAQGRVGLIDVLRQVKHYHKMGMPRHFGLFETNIIIRDNSSVEIMNMMNDWWTEMLNYTKRDQLSFTYVLWKNSKSVDYVYSLGTNSRKSAFFDVIRHA